MILRPHLLLLVLASLFALPAAEDPPGDAPAGDPRVAALLKAAKLEFTLDADGDYKLVNETVKGDATTKDRTQLAFVFSETSELGSMELRQVWSCAYSATEPIPAELAAKMLEQNGKTKLGAWQVTTMDDKHVAMFCAKIPADLTDPAHMLIAIHAVTTTADAMEQELTGKDDF